MASRKGPVHSVDEVRACAVRRAVELMTSSARNPLRDHFGSNAAGVAAACGALAALVIDDYVESVVLDTTQQPADVYGVVVDGRDWYVKLYLTVDVEALTTTSPFASRFILPAFR